MIWSSFSGGQSKYRAGDSSQINLFNLISKAAQFDSRPNYVHHFDTDEEKPIGLRHIYSFQFTTIAGLKSICTFATVIGYNDC